LCSRETAARELARAVGGETVPRRALRTKSFDVILNATPSACTRTMRFALAGASYTVGLSWTLFTPREDATLEARCAKAHRHRQRVEMFLAQGIAHGNVDEAPARRRLCGGGSGTLRLRTRAEFIVIRPDFVNSSAWPSKAI